jgi:hypothetical protein
MFTQPAGVSEPMSIILDQDPKPSSTRWLHAEISAKAEITAWVLKLNADGSIDCDWRRNCNLLGVNRSTDDHDLEN